MNNINRKILGPLDPTKERIEKPIFDYQKILYGHNFKHKHLWVKKATGLGVTEFFPRLMI